MVPSFQHFLGTQFYPAFRKTLPRPISLLTLRLQILTWKGDVFCLLLLQCHPILQLEALKPASNSTSEDQGNLKQSRAQEQAVHGHLPSVVFKLET